MKRGVCPAFTANQSMNQPSKIFRRIVTGHDVEGNAVIVSDAPPFRSQLVGGPGGPTFVEVWQTLETPALIQPQPQEPEQSGLTLAPPPNGTRIRVIEFPPEGDAIRNLTSAEALGKFQSMRGGHAATSSGEGAPHPLMHRTKTVDYGIVLEGEMTLIVDRGETTIRAGDVVIQNGTNHAWANRSGAICRMAFILIDGKYPTETTSTLEA
jgi:mannose-6-phosphate isomerase-like protein (cupin superfamily)